MLFIVSFLLLLTPNTFLMDSYTLYICYIVYIIYIMYNYNNKNILLNFNSYFLYFLLKNVLLNFITLCVFLFNFFLHHSGKLRFKHPLRWKPLFKKSSYFGLYRSTKNQFLNK